MYKLNLKKEKELILYKFTKNNKISWSAKGILLTHIVTMKTPFEYLEIEKMQKYSLNTNTISKSIEELVENGYLIYEKGGEE